MSEVSSVISTAKGTDKLKAYGQVMAMADAASTDLKMLSGADSEYNPYKDYSTDELELRISKINKMCDIVLDEYKKNAHLIITALSKIKKAYLPDSE